MVEIRKTEVFADWLDGLRDIRARARVQVRIERLEWGTRGMLAPLAKVYPNCGLIMVLVIGCISNDEGTKSSFSWLVVIKALRPVTLKPHCALPAICKD